MPRLACIGNKQDLPEAMPIADIERILGIKTYTMVASDPENRVKMITIFGDILEMSGEVDSILKPLKDRDQKLVEAEMHCNKAISNPRLIFLRRYQNFARMLEITSSVKNFMRRHEKCVLLCVN